MPNKDLSRARSSIKYGESLAPVLHALSSTDANFTILDTGESMKQI